jgi:hypothetical protein
MPDKVPLCLEAEKPKNRSGTAAARCLRVQVLKPIRSRPRSSKRCTGEVAFGELIRRPRKGDGAPSEKMLADAVGGLADKNSWNRDKGRPEHWIKRWRYWLPQWRTHRSACSPS